MQEEAKRWTQLLNRKHTHASKQFLLTIHSIQDYLSSTNVQLGASYAVGQRSTMLYDAGYDAAADYINASPDEIGRRLPPFSRTTF